MGVVASRRARGDRIELWVGGKAKKEPTPGDWIDRLKEVLADQLEMPEVSFSRVLSPKRFTGSRRAILFFRTISYGRASTRSTSRCDTRDRTRAGGAELS